METYNPYLTEAEYEAIKASRLARTWEVIGVAVGLGLVVTIAVVCAPRWIEVMF